MAPPSGFRAFRKATLFALVALTHIGTGPALSGCANNDAESAQKVADGGVTSPSRPGPDASGGAHIADRTSDASGPGEANAADATFDSYRDVVDARRTRDHATEPDCHAELMYPVDPSRECVRAPFLSDRACPYQAFDALGASMNSWTCIVSPEGEMYLTRINSAIDFAAEGWTRSSDMATQVFPETLTAEESARCWRLIYHDGGYGPPQCDPDASVP